MNEPAQAETARILAAIGDGDRQAAGELLPLVYDNLRRLAQKKLSDEPAGITLQATALVHEAYLRLLGPDGSGWEGQRHFFNAAAEAMRRILIERARRYRRVKHGGGRRRVPLRELEMDGALEADDLVALDAAIRRLAAVDGRAGEVVMLRFFGGLEIERIAELLEVSVSTINREWRAARAWLFDEMTGAERDAGSETGP